jgi:hypothetical protein
MSWLTDALGISGPNYDTLSSDKQIKLKKLFKELKKVEKGAVKDVKKQDRQETKEEKRDTRTGREGFDQFKQNIKTQLDLGLIDITSAENKTRDYTEKYGLKKPEKFIGRLTARELRQVPKERIAGVKSIYQELLGRRATPKEIEKAKGLFDKGVYTSVDQFKEFLSKSPEYTNKFESSFYENYLTSSFGKQTVDKKGRKTGERTFEFSPKLLPDYAKGTQKRTGIELPDFKKKFTGTTEELKEQVQSIRDARQYLYSAGLTSLQGDIDTNIKKLDSESKEEIAKIGTTGSIYSNLVSGFWG